MRYDLLARVLVFGGLIVLSGGVGSRVSDAGIVYRRSDSSPIGGAWTTNPDNTFFVQPSAQMFDLNSDDSFEFELGHDYRRPPMHLPKQAADLAGSALIGLEDVALRLQSIRTLALSSANAGVNDADKFEVNQRAIDNQLDWINRMANNWQHAGAPVLNGSLGFNGISSDQSAITVNRATAETTPGVYSISVETPARRGAVSSLFAQAAALLSSDETITINGVNIELSQGSYQDDVISRINDFTALTGVTADDGGAGGETRLYSSIFGSAGEVKTISNVAASSTSSGFGTTQMEAEGADAVIFVDGERYLGQGATVTLSGGPAKGLSVTLRTDGTDDTQSVATTARVTVSDASAQFVLLPDGTSDSISLSLPRVHSSALGIGVANNQFSNLAEVNVTNADKAQDAISTIDAAANYINDERQRVGLFLRNGYLPNGFAEFRPLGSASLFVDRGELAELLEGQLVGEGREFSDSWLTYDAQLVDDGLNADDKETRFFGFRFEQEGQPHYGWMRVSFDIDNQLRLLDYAFESEPKRSIRAGFVPEPTGATSLFVLLALSAWWMRFR